LLLTINPFWALHFYEISFNWVKML